MNKPIEITLPEWEEIMQVPRVRHAWGIEKDESAAKFASWVYGVKFHFESGSPGYCGDVYIIHPDTLNRIPPWVLTRREGKLRLEVVEDEIRWGAHR
jgi:hypothetical protein